MPTSSRINVKGLMMASAPELVAKANTFATSSSF